MGHYKVLCRGVIGFDLYFIINIRGASVTTENCSSPSETWQLGLGSGSRGQIYNQF